MKRKASSKINMETPKRRARVAGNVETKLTSLKIATSLKAVNPQKANLLPAII